jgi:hypothetical protein
MIEVLEEVEKRNRELGRELGKEKKEREERRDESERMARLLSEYRLEIIRSKDAEEVSSMSSLWVCYEHVPHDQPSQGMNGL